MLRNGKNAYNDIISYIFISYIIISLINILLMTTPTTNPACIPPTNSRAPLWSRARLICPPGLTPAQNKAEVLQYKGNAYRLTKKQQLSRNIRGFGPLGNKVWATQNDYGSNPNVLNLEQQGNTLILCPEPPPIIVCPSGIQILDISNVATQNPLFPIQWSLNENTTIFKCQNLIIKNGESLNINNKTLIVEGTITNNGTIVNNTNDIITNNGGIINNNNGGIIDNNNGGIINNNNGGIINNNTGGIIYNNNVSSINNNNSRITNNGGIIDTNNSFITNNTTGTIDNTNGGLIDNGVGNINNTGIIYNHQAITLISLYNGGSITNGSGGIIYNYDSGTISINAFTSITNDLGTINSPASDGGCGIGTINNSGSIFGNPPITSATACPPSPP